MIAVRRRLAAFLSALGMTVFGDLAAAAEPQRRYEIYSDVHDSGSDLVGTELELFLWEDSADATLTIFRRFVETRPIRLHGAGRQDQVFLSVTQGEESIEIRGRRSSKRFTGEMTYKRSGEVVRTDPLDLPRRKLK